MAARRITVAVPLLAAVSVGVFMLAAVSPFDPLTAYLGSSYQQASDATKQAMSEVYGLNQHWWDAWWQWVAGLVHGDLGVSHVYHQPVTTVIAERLPWTLLLSSTGLLLAIAIAVPFGVAAGTRPGCWCDRACRACGVGLQAIPPFVVALAAVAVFAVALPIAPVSGAYQPGEGPSLGQVAMHLPLPALALAVTQLPWLLLAVREAAAQTSASDAVRGARARGIDAATIRRRHILPVSLAPMVTIIGARLPELITGAVLVETVFAWPGLAAAVTDSAKALDFGLLAFLTVATTAVVLTGSLIADLSYTFLDPRVSDDQ